MNGPRALLNSRVPESREGGIGALDRSEMPQFYSSPLLRLMPLPGIAKHTSHYFTEQTLHTAVILRLRTKYFPDAAREVLAALPRSITF